MGAECKVCGHWYSDECNTYCSYDCSVQDEKNKGTWIEPRLNEKEYEKEHDRQRKIQRQMESDIDDVILPIIREYNKENRWRAKYSISFDVNLKKDNILYHSKKDDLKY